MTFNEFVQEYKLKIKAKSNIEIQQVLFSLNFNVIKIYWRNGPISSYIGIVTLHPLEGTHWVVYMNEKFFDSYGCVCPKKLSRFNLKRIGYCPYSEYKIQRLTNKRDSYCASYCFYINCLTKVIGIDFKPDVFNFNYQSIKIMLMFLSK